MKVKFQADADFNERIGRAVRFHEPAVDFQSADDAGLRGWDDPDVLAYAAAEGRILVSHDLTTMPGHFANFIANNTSAGLLIIRQKVPIHLALDEILHVWRTSEAKDWINQMRVI